MKRPSFSRVGLPILAAIGVVAAAIMVADGQPDRARTDPVELPPTSPQAQAATGTVAAAGVVEPSSELIEVGAQRPGLVTNVAVVAGDRVGPGQLLFAIDGRDALSQVGEARAALALARQRVASARVDLLAAQRQFSIFNAVNDPRAVAEQQVVDRRSQRDQAAARLEVAQAEAAQAAAQLASAQTNAGLLQVRAPRAAQVLQVRTRIGEYATAGPGPGNSDPLMILGETRPLHVRIDIDESEIERAALGAAAAISPRGVATRRVQARFVRAEPLVIPKRSLTNESTERVDVRVLQLIYALPIEAAGFFVGQQVDAYVPARLAPGRNAVARAQPR